MIPGLGSVMFEEGDTLLDLMERHAEIEEEIADHDSPSSTEDEGVQI